MKQVKKLKNEAPDDFEAVVQGKTSVKKALKKLGDKKPAPKKDRPEAAKEEESETPTPDGTWNMGFTAFGYISPPKAQSPQDILKRLNAGTLKFVWSGRIEEADGTLVAELTDPDAKDFVIENE